MDIELVEQQSTDFDWSGVDEEGWIGHFTSAGFKYLPQSVSSSSEDLRLVTEFFQNHAPVKGAHMLDGDLANVVPDWRGENNEARYLGSFVSMADKGLFSYDINSYLSPGAAYFRVASPESPLPLEELPSNIRTVLSRTVLRTC
jgi:hypothetical protein